MLIILWKMDIGRCVDDAGILSKNNNVIWHVIKV